MEKNDNADCHNYLLLPILFIYNRQRTKSNKNCTTMFLLYVFYVLSVWLFNIGLGTSCIFVSSTTSPFRAGSDYVTPTTVVRDLGLGIYLDSDAHFRFLADRTASQYHIISCHMD